MVEKVPSHNPCDLILFGVLGDLSCRKLLPALYQLELTQLLHPLTRILGCDREQISQIQYLKLIKAKLQQFLTTDFDEVLWEKFCARLVYCQLDLSQANEYQKISQYVKYNNQVVISYFAIAPQFYAQVCQGLSEIGLTSSSCRVVLEKPLGHDLPSSIAINNEVGRYFSEDQIYRMDHYLGKETVLNLMVLRFANSIFSNWDNQFIEKIVITVAEEIGVEGRWEYYDQAGQLRDMLQNHVLQILSLVAMEPPLSLEAENIQNEKLKVLKSLRIIDKENIGQHTLRAQYQQNELNGRFIAGYVNECSTLTGSNTETLVAVKAYIDNWRWSGVPFYLVTGKRLAKKQSEVVIHFKQQPYNIFSQVNQLAPNQLIIRLQPDEGVAVRIINKIPGLTQQMQLEDNQLNLNFNTEQRIPDAYERLLLEVMEGNHYLFVSRQEIEQAWRWVDVIRNNWEQQQVPLLAYPAGSWDTARVIEVLEGQ